MTTVITYGTFDLLHIGHLNVFKRLKEMGTRLLVGVSTDEFNLGKGKRAFIPFEHRIELVRSLKYVDEAFPEENWDQKVSDVEKYGADVFAIGDDWQGKFDFLKDRCEVVCLPRTVGISSTELRNSLAAINPKSIDDLRLALEAVASIVDGLGR